MSYKTAAELLAESAARDAARKRLAEGADLAETDLELLTAREVSEAVERGQARSVFSVSPRRRSR